MVSPRGYCYIHRIIIIWLHFKDQHDVTNARSAEAECGFVYTTFLVHYKSSQNGEVKRKFLFSTWKLTYQNNKENPLGP